MYKKLAVITLVSVLALASATFFKYRLFKKDAQRNGKTLSFFKASKY